MSRDASPDMTGLLTCKACGANHYGWHACANLAANPTPDASPDPAVVTPDAGVDTALIVSSLMAGRVSGPEAVAALDAQIANHVAAAREADRAEVERLRHWKDEALPVIDGLQELGKALDMPLGARITGPDALVAVQRLTERAEAAEEQLAGLVAKIEAEAHRLLAEDPHYTPRTDGIEALRDAILTAGAATALDGSES